MCECSVIHWTFLQVQGGRTVAHCEGMVLWTFLDIFGHLWTTEMYLLVLEGMANMANNDVGHNLTHERPWTSLALNVV